MPRGSPWHSLSQVPTFQGRTREPGQGAMLGSRSEQARPTAAPVWSDLEASSLACLGASVPRLGVLARLCPLLSLARAGPLLQAQLWGPRGPGGGHMELSPAGPLSGAQRSLCRLRAPVFPRRRLRWQEKGRERASRGSTNMEDAADVVASQALTPVREAASSSGSATG